MIGSDGLTRHGSAPKVYGFDTGFVCCFRGIDRPRREDLGLLWEHFVLNEIQTSIPQVSFGHDISRSHPNHI